jgi:uncharacterized OB-fold protein
MTTQKPLPRITPDNAEFWAGCRRHELVLPVCGECGRAHLPPGPVCPFCFSDAILWRKAAGTGMITSFTIVHKAWFPAFDAEIPYNVVQVELDEGPRLTANVVGAPNEAIAVGRKVRVVFDDVTPDVTLPRFRLL